MNRENMSQAFGEALVTAGKKCPELVVIDADIADSCNTEEFGRQFPERTLELGIAEQSLPTFAAGLALCGWIPVYNSFAPFAVLRGLDMIRQSIAYNRTNVKIVGHAAGQTMGYTGPTHHTIEDISALRAISNLVILQPSDSVEVRLMVDFMISYNGPVYLRLPRVDAITYHHAQTKFLFPEPELVRPGTDISVFVTGDLVGMILELAEEVQETISIQVVNVSVLKPLSVKGILELGRITSCALTVEDHNVLGGLGSGIAEIYSENIFKPVYRIGIPDIFTESDSCEELREKYGLGRERILKKINEVFNRILKKIK